MKRLLALLLVVYLAAWSLPAQAQTDASHLWIKAVAAPTVTGCGTGATVLGNDSAGVITMGTGVVTTCTLTFARAWVVAPVCVGTPTLAVTVSVTPPTTTQVDWAFSLTLASAKLFYLCTYGGLWP